MDKALGYLSLARKAGRVELGEEPVGAAARAHHARLLVVAGDASDHTWRRAKSFVNGTDQQCLRVPYTKQELGQATGRTELALAALTDPSMAVAFVKALENPEKYAEVLEKLTQKAQRIDARQKEAKAHARNVKKGQFRCKPKVK